MRATIEAHNQAAIEQVMQALGTANPSVAVNYIINHYRLGQSGSIPTPQGPVNQAPVSQSIDDFAVIEDWS
jgi:Tfp pilus assembly protein FimV